MSNSGLMNPLAYWCPPNGCTPEYLPSHDLQDFLAYGLLMCWIEPRDTVCTVTPGDVLTLRAGFLNCVEDAVRFWREQEAGQDTSCDPAQPTVTFDLPDGDCYEAGWRFERVDDDALLFVFIWTGADDTAIWLAKGAIEGKESEALAAIQSARRVLGREDDR